MALTTAESQKLQETYNLATQVNNNAQKLYEIFSQGGVSNPDLAVLKANLETQIDNCVKLTPSIPSQYIYSDIILQNSYEYKRCALVDSSNYIQGYDFSTYVYDKSKSQNVAVLLFAYQYNNLVPNPTIYIRGYSHISNDNMQVAIRVDNSDDKRSSFIEIPTPPIELQQNDSSVQVNYGAVNIEYLNNTANSVVHKTGTETISGAKTFTAVLTTNANISCTHIVPQKDNSYSLGTSSLRFANIYAGNGTIQTSDENLKTEIRDIPEAVLRAWGKVKFQQFKFKDAVKKKGDDARIHIGIIAQRIKEAFESEGLDAHKYGLFCWDEWDDQYEDVHVLVSSAQYREITVASDPKLEGIIVDPNTFSGEYHTEQQLVKVAEYKVEHKFVKSACKQYSLRYEQCLCLECAYQRWRLEQLEAKLNNQA